MQFTADTDYNYAFNGKEKESGGLDGNLDFGARVYNSEVGSFLSRDPYESIYQNMTPYQYAGNSPIAFFDFGGLKINYYQDRNFVKNNNKLKEKNEPTIDSSTLPTMSDEYNEWIKEGESAIPITRAKLDKVIYNEVGKAIYQGSPEYSKIEADIPPEYFKNLEVNINVVVSDIDGHSEKITDGIDRKSKSVASGSNFMLETHTDGIVTNWRFLESREAISFRENFQLSDWFQNQKKPTKSEIDNLVGHLKEKFGTSISVTEVDIIIDEANNFASIEDILAHEYGAVLYGIENPIEQYVWVNFIDGNMDRNGGHKYDYDPHDKGSQLQFEKK